MMETTRFRRRDLPHWDVPGGTYFVTACLEGSVPAKGLLDLTRYRKELEARERPKGMTKDEWDVRCWKLRFGRLEKYLDEDPAVRWLQRAELAAAVRDSLLHFAGQRYDLFAYVIMPSHFHWVFRPRPEWVTSLPNSRPYRSPRERIMYSVRRFSARRCNELLGRCGTFWQHESFDHWIRDGDELERVIVYIETNPVKSKLVARPEDWMYSSANQRYRLGLAHGSLLTRLQ